MGTSTKITKLGSVQWALKSQSHCNREAS